MWYVFMILGAMSVLCAVMSEALAFIFRNQMVAFTALLHEALKARINTKFCISCATSLYQTPAEILPESLQIICSYVDRTAFTYGVAVASHAEELTTPGALRRLSSQIGDRVNWRRSRKFVSFSCFRVQVLSDPQKKERYDSGVDLEDLDNPHAGPGHRHG